MLNQANLYVSKKHNQLQIVLGTSREKGQWCHKFQKLPYMASHTFEEKSEISEIKDILMIFSPKLHDFSFPPVK